MNTTTATAQFLDDLRAGGARPATLDKYGSDMRIFVEFAGDADVSAVNPATIRKWISNPDWSPATARRRYATLRSLFGWLVEQEIIENNPVVKVARPKLEQNIPRVVDHDDVKRLLALDLDPKYRAIIEVLFGAGLRLGELLALRRSDVDVNRLYIRHTKGHRDRIVPIGGPAVRALKAQMREVTGDLLFPSQVDPSRPMDQSSVRSRLYNLANKAGIKKFNPHALRHGCATAMLEGGASIRDLQEQLGHVRLDQTARYTHISSQRLQDVHAKSHPRGGDHG